MIKRILEKRIRSRLFSGKAVLLMGPRQTGKTTLLHALFDGAPDVKWPKPSLLSPKPSPRPTQRTNYK